MKHITDITIIGSGIIGMLTAKALLQAGLSITIIEKNTSAQEASWAGGGILLPLYPWRQADAISQLVIPSLKMYPTLAEELFSATQIDPEWTQCGLLITQNPDIDFALDWCKKYAIDVCPIKTDFLNQLQTETQHPLWLPTIAQARNPRLLKSLRTFLIQLGVTFIEDCTVVDIAQKQDKIHSIGTTRGIFPINHLILATGAWTSELCMPLFSDYQAPVIFPVKGQMLLFDAPADLLPFIVLEKEHYLIPRRDGKIIAGSSVEYTNFNKEISEETQEELLTFATTILPPLKECPILNHWSGLRPGTQYGIPYIDNHPSLANLSIHAGHFRNGLTMAPASAQLLADLILKRTPSVNPIPYQLMRNNL